MPTPIKKILQNYYNKIPFAFRKNKKQIDEWIALPVLERQDKNGKKDEKNEEIKEEKIILQFKETKENQKEENQKEEVNESFKKNYEKKRNK